MPATTSGSIDAVGVKIVSVYFNNIQKGLPSVPTTMIVVDVETEIVSSVMDGTFFNQLRSRSVQGAAPDLMPKKMRKLRR